jgi:hypothetical protein
VKHGRKKGGKEKVVEDVMEKGQEMYYFYFPWPIYSTKINATCSNSERTGVVGTLSNHHIVKGVWLSN